MSEKSLYVDSTNEPWRETPYVGVSWKKLSFDAASGRSSVLVRFEPNTIYGAHSHPGGEEYYVLEGTLEDGGRTWGPGSYVCNPPGSRHRPFSRDGCVLIISLPRPIEPLTDQECKALGPKPQLP